MKKGKEDRGVLEKKDNLVDLFAGCGGSGGGILSAAKAIGRSVQGHFVNHWEKAIEIHEANHPEHKHYTEDLFHLDPNSVIAAGAPCSLLWASPACTHFSLARGSACVSEQERSHIDSVTKWVAHIRPELAIVENVREFLTHGPVIQKRGEDGELAWSSGNRPVLAMADSYKRRRKETEDAWSCRMLGMGFQRHMIPDKSRAGEYYDRWVRDVVALGYDVEHRILCSADYGDPTIRRRLFIQLCRKDSGKRIVWPNPTHAKPDKNGNVPEGLRSWRTAREIIDWNPKGTSVFKRPKPLAPNTLRRLVIGLVKFGLKDFLLPKDQGWKCDNVRSLDEPVPAVQTTAVDHVVQPAAFLIPNFGEAPGQTPRTHSLDDPLPTVTSHGAGGLVEPQAFLLPSNKGWTENANIRGIDEPLTTLTTKSRAEGLVQPCVIQLKGQSTAQSIDGPLTAVTSQQGHYLSVPMIDHLRGQGVARGVDEPVPAITAGGSRGGRHQALADAFMFAIDQTGGGRNHGTYSVDEPLRTVVAKANATCIEFSLVELEETFRTNCRKAGIGNDSAATFLDFLIKELKEKAKIDAKPWIYVYYSSGAEGADIDTPLPTVRAKAGTAVCYPVIEFDGRFIRIDLLYRMLTVRELQRAMGFPEDMKWAGSNQEDMVRAIGNSVSHGVARALAAACWTQNPDVTGFLEPAG